MIGRCTGAGSVGGGGGDDDDGGSDGGDGDDGDDELMPIHDMYPESVVDMQECVQYST